MEKAEFITKKHVTKSIFICAICVFLLNSKLSFSQLGITIMPGIESNCVRVNFGHAKKLIPFIGLQYAKTKYTYIETGKIYDWEKKILVNSEETIQFEGNVVVPNIGIRYKLLGKGSLQTYSNVCLSKPFTSGGYKRIGYVDDAFNKDVDKLNVFGLEAGFGAEYKIGEQYSFGAEYGLQKYFINYTKKIYKPVLNKHSGEVKDILFESQVKSNLNPVYFRICLNFYFN